MKKLHVAFIALILAIAATGCSNNENIEQISERFFVQQVNNIWFNLDSYVGRTIQLEGMFFNWRAAQPDGTIGEFHFVVRFLSGCCGNDGNIGFEVAMGDFEPFADDTWVSVTGVLGIAEGVHGNTPMLRVTAIEALAERGAEFVLS
ncbi:MAG: hypothetical protein FWE42_00445 [Defluviitaleaceae bacterium]|nr:hypothetical protein [Defluviitaleaceae bacterium]